MSTPELTSPAADSISIVIDTNSHENASSELQQLHEVQKSDPEVVDSSVKSRRIRRCAGCHATHDVHLWGMPGPYCQGKDAALQSDDTKYSLPTSQPSSASQKHDPASQPSAKPRDREPSRPSSAEKLALEEKLRELRLEEEHLQEMDTLRKKLAEKGAVVSKLRQRQSTAALPLPGQPLVASKRPEQDGQLNQGLNVQMLQNPPTQLQPGIPATPSLSNLLGTVGNQSAQGATWMPQQPPITADGAPISLHDRFAANKDRHADMFLAPASVPLGEKVLRIVDFLSTLVPKESERTLSDFGDSRIFISYGQQRPRLEGVSLSQWVVANTRIFHNLLFANKLPTSHDVRDYLAYTVKIMELAGKYEWVSVLKFDDEYRQLQATYGFPWSHDSHHLHEVTLVPMAKPKLTGSSQQHQSPNNSFSGPPTAVYSADGAVICRNYNGKECHNPACSFVHVCNRKFKGKACSSPHPATLHSAQGGPSK